MTPFKTCQNCGATWATREAFYLDPKIQLIGYMAHFKDLDKGFFLFNHILEGCGSTISIEVRDFDDLYTGPRYTENAHGSSECEGHCARVEELRACHAKCENAWAREILRIILYRRREALGHE